MSDDFFAPPPFKAADALALLKRQLRDLRPLTERSSGYEINGKPMISLAVAASGDAIEARLARRPAMTPDFEKIIIRSGADQRKFVDAVKARLARLDNDD
jgi:hypothetical protein